MIAIHNETQVQVEAVLNEGPCNLNLGPNNGGDFCAEAGQWIVYFPGNWPLVLTDAQFQQQFTVI